ncbi:hypothetical protein F4604DRAFT_1939687 [Suillus subluteus]|nr:hypothetical protein F4604DRAFT_1939687 [Suillus subluteus]
MDPTSTSAPRFDLFMPTDASIIPGLHHFNLSMPSDMSITAGPRSNDLYTPATASITAGPHSNDLFTPATVSITSGPRFNSFTPPNVSFTSGLRPPGLLNPSIMSNTAGLCSTAPPDLSNTISDEFKVSNIPSVSESRDNANESLIPPVTSIEETTTIHEPRIVKARLSLLAQTALDNANENNPPTFTDQFTTGLFSPQDFFDSAAISYGTFFVSGANLIWAGGAPFIWWRNFLWDFSPQYSF